MPETDTSVSGKAGDAADPSAPEPGRQASAAQELRTLQAQARDARIRWSILQMPGWAITSSITGTTDPFVITQMAARAVRQQDQTRALRDRAVELLDLQPEQRTPAEQSFVETAGKVVDGENRVEALERAYDLEVDRIFRETNLELMAAVRTIIMAGIRLDPADIATATDQQLRRWRNEEDRVAKRSVLVLAQMVSRGSATRRTSDVSLLRHIAEQFPMDSDHFVMSVRLGIDAALVDQPDRSRVALLASVIAPLERLESEIESAKNKATLEDLHSAYQEMLRDWAQRRLARE